MGVGVVIRDNKECVIAALSKPIQALYEPVTAEASIALCAVELCREVGIFDIFLEVDSLLVVKVIYE